MNATKLSALLTTAAVALTPVAAQAKATGTGAHLVNKQVYVYQQPAKIFDGTAFKGDNFKVKRISKSGKWAYGYFNRVSRNVWISTSALNKKK